MTFTNFIKRPVLSTVISIFFVLLGTIGLVSLPIEQYPNIAPPTISVMANYPGADAQTVLNSVVTPLEESINGVENMTYITSSASNPTPIWLPSTSTTVCSRLRLCSRQR